MISGHTYFFLSLRPKYCSTANLTISEGCTRSRTALIFISISSCSGSIYVRLTSFSIIHLPTLWTYIFILMSILSVCMDTLICWTLLSIVMSCRKLTTKEVKGTKLSANGLVDMMHCPYCEQHVESLTQHLEENQDSVHDWRNVK